MMHEPDNNLQKQRIPASYRSLFEWCSPRTTSMPLTESDFGALLEPTPIGAPRSTQQAADSSAILKESLRFLFQDCNREASNCSAAIPTPVVSLLAAQYHDGGDSTFKNKKNEGSSIRPRTPCCGISSQAPEDSSMMYTKSRFQVRHKDQWETQFQLLQEFKRKHGHCRIPHTYPENQSLARWVKRQRHQHKQKQMGEKTTMTTRRIRALEELGFIWDSHSASWEQRMSDLLEFRDKHGHCHVPTHYQENKQLAIWVKCQRRQHKLLKQGRSSTLTSDRLEVLDKVGFEWRAKRTTGKTTTHNDN
ncbi:unnamed protein product [Cylindrotheca closterium]|uniref:Helicase-associated domain-containing protein n=1 Tax=Cylindrotheca closterium TaxID=2856 RepID=A0AAD2FXH2_9STRA|nr:unnamed protein product [Cylindrotheca closterium]